MIQVYEFAEGRDDYSGQQLFVLIEPQTDGLFQSLLVGHPIQFAKFPKQFLNLQLSVTWGGLQYNRFSQVLLPPSLRSSSIAPVPESFVQRLKPKCKDKAFIFKACCIRLSLCTRSPTIESLQQTICIINKGAIEMELIMVPALANLWQRFSEDLLAAFQCPVSRSCSTN